MTVSLTLDVTISLIFVFVLAALLASTVNEMISGMLKLRGVYLTKAIESLTSLDAGNVFSWGGVGGWFYAHFRQSRPTVTCEVDKAAVAITDCAKAAAARAGATAASVQAAMTTAIGACPAGIAGRFRQLEQRVAAVATGATADEVLGIILPIGGIASLQSHPLLVGTPSSLPSYVPARNFGAAMLGVLKDGSAAAPFEQVKNAIMTLPEGDLKTQLLAFIAAGADDIDMLRTRIENWFDDGMERLSGIYTRSTQYIMLVLGLILAIFMNIDSVHLAKALWEQPAMSRAISDGAAHFVSDNGQTLFCQDGAAAGTCKKIDLKTIQGVIDQQMLPIGRSGTDQFGCRMIIQDGKQVADPGCDTAAWKGWTIVGWLVTAIAVSLGAQFWFGLLSQLINLRAAGDKPDRSNATS